MGQFHLANTGHTDQQFDSGAVAITDASSYVGLVDASGNDTLLIAGSSGRVLINGLVGAGGAIGAFKITRAATVGGVHKDFLVGTDFNTAIVNCPWATADLYTTSANGSFQIEMFLPGTAELKFYAKKSSGNTTLRLTGTVVGR